MQTLIKNLIKFGKRNPGKKDKKRRILEDGVPSTLRQNLEAFEAQGNDREWQQLMMYCLVMEKTADIPGDIAEFGVGSGTSFKALVRLNNILNKSRPHKGAVKSVYGFDSFEGLPALNKQIDLAGTDGAEHGDMREGGFNSSKTMGSLLDFCSQNGNCKIIKGWFADTVRDFVGKNPSLSFSLIHVDCDLYSSTKEVLNLCLKRLNVGGVILFDEIFHKGFPGETEAFWEVYNSINKEISLQFHKIPSMPWKWYCVRTS